MLSNVTSIPLLVDRWGSSVLRSKNPLRTNRTFSIERNNTSFSRSIELAWSIDQATEDFRTYSIKHAVRSYRTCYGIINRNNQTSLLIIDPSPVQSNLLQYNRTFPTTIEPPPSQSYLLWRDHFFPGTMEPPPEQSNLLRNNQTSSGAIIPSPE